jgi:glycosyltransferase 2 family protein
VLRKVLFNIVKFTLFLGVGGGLLWLITKDLTPQDKKDIADSFRNANYWYVLISVGIGVLSHILRALRWQMMLQPLGHAPRLLTIFYAVMVAYLANLAVPRLGEVTRCGIMQRYEKVPFDKAVGTIVVERGIDLISLGIVTVLALLVQFTLIRDFFNEKVLFPIAAKVQFTLVTWLILGAVVLVLFLVGRWAIGKWKHTDLYLRLRLLAMNVRDGIYSIRHLKNIPLFIGYSVGIWICYYAMIHVCFFAIEETSGYGLPQGLSILVFGTLGIISTPGGIGAYQFIVTELLNNVYLLVRPVAYAFSWIVWVGQTIMIISFGLLSLLLLPLMAPKSESHEPETGH